MNAHKIANLDGNEAAASVAHRLSEVIAIYPITPASPMGEFSDAWTAAGHKNIWGTVPSVTEMQSEGGAAGAVHGALQLGALSTTFTASQGLLLMIPNMYKMAGELSPTVIHVAARTLATHALSIFGDHSDVMAVRQTGFALLASNSVQEAADLACVAHTATLEARVPFCHFFDGFRTSHEVNKVRLPTDEVLRAMVSDELVRAHRARGMRPETPVLRGTAQNPDVFFQAREACNPFYDATPGIVQKTMDRYAELTGRAYHLFDYEGAPDAERVIVVMGSGAETVADTVAYLNGKGEKVGVLKVRLYRPFSMKHFVQALPKTTKTVVVLDRTKEPGAPAEPLHLDVQLALNETLPAAERPRVIGGRFGLSSKEFTPAMVKAIYDEAAKDAPKNHFTVGIFDDVTNLSLPWDSEFTIESEDMYRALFFGLGSDGTVSANKSSIKLIGDLTENNTQGHFVYDSKKAGATTVSHLRFGPKPIRSPYEVTEAHLVACHQPMFLDRFDILAKAKRGGTFLLNTPVAPDKVFESLPAAYQKRIVERGLKVFAIDAAKVALEAGMGNRINTVMQTAFFAVSKVLPIDQAIGAIKEGIEKTYGAKGRVLVEKNFAAVDASVANLHPVPVPEKYEAGRALMAPVPEHVPDFVKRVTGRIIAGEGDLMPVSAFPVDGTFPTATTQWEKRDIAAEIPVWDMDVCIQCNKCAMVCPHAAIRVKAFPPTALEGAPESFLSMKYKAKDFADHLYTVQVAPEDCTGCGVCVEVCPAKNKAETGRKAINMTRKGQVFDVEKERYDFFLKIPDPPRDTVRLDTVKGSQFLQPLFEYSGACAGCGETPYVKLASQLFGDRMVVANATGCSSIYGGNLPTTPWAVDANGRGPTWNNSLFEDNAEFGMGMRLAIDEQEVHARNMLQKLAGQLGDDLVGKLMGERPRDEAGYAERRQQVAALREKLKGIETADARDLESLVDVFVPRSVWIIGGDGWAYDIGYGGLDHVLASGQNVNVLVLDTEVYSNTGGQMSKSTPKGAVAKFAAGGKSMPKKDLAMMAMAYGNVYVARVAMGASDAQTVKAFIEAEAYDGPSLILAYSHCIAHGINMAKGMEQQDLAVKTGYWPLLRFDPRRAAAGEAAFLLDSKAAKMGLGEYTKGEGRYRMLVHADPELAKKLGAEAESEARARYGMYENMAKESKESAEKGKEEDAA